ncbi:IclR family transcriptional regulator [Anaerobiospirillum thomasii]|uniref:HTH-type transcriptional repressor AllR n=1 Tax=Anaerobiospirillum thomasii TaxID=179995 RepID=A0A2X0WEX3_9GAMM|nr:IclR family transcriptional regulator [Anaerobiospirillum thomasii]SPT68927.1 Transcriptional regulator kdgR [Anaerobiospirillum thomasii]
MKDSSNINLLHKAMDIIELLTNEKREMGVTEISRRLNLVKSGTFRILNTLKDRGFIFQNSQTKAYGLGLKFYFVGAEVQSRLPLCVAAQKALSPLSEYFKQSFYLAIPFLSSDREQEIIIIYTTACREIKSVVNKISAGLIVPAHSLAIGQCILAHMSDSELQTIKGSELSKVTDDTIVSWSVLEKKIEQIRDKNVAVCDGTFCENIMDIAVGVYDSMHYPIGAIGIYGNSIEIKGVQRDSLIRKLNAASAKISESL